MSVALTTIDNPFNPISQFDDWYAFDTQKGYNTCSYLARIARTSPEVSPIENEVAIESAIDEIVKLDLTGKYIKITENSTSGEG